MQHHGQRASEAERAGGGAASSGPAPNVQEMQRDLQRLHVGSADRPSGVVGDFGLRRALGYARSVGAAGHAPRGNRATRAHDARWAAVLTCALAVACGGEARVSLRDAGFTSDAGFFAPRPRDARVDAASADDAAPRDLDAEPSPDAIDPRDAGAEDATPRDADAEDAATAPDAEVARDTGAAPDATIAPDASAPDATIAPDAGPTPDASTTPDAGTPRDAGFPDAGTITQGGGLMISGFRAAGRGPDWIEVYNTTTIPLELTTYAVVLGGTATLPVRAPTDPTGAAGTRVPIAPGAYARLAPNPASGPPPAWATALVGPPGVGDDLLRDAGDVITLRTAAGLGDQLDFRRSARPPARALGLDDFPIIDDVATELDAPLVGPGGELANDRALGWCVQRARGDTPGAANRSCTAHVLNEVLYDWAAIGVTVDEGQEFIELAGPAGGSLQSTFVAGVEGSVAAAAPTNGTPIAINATRMPLDGLYVIGDVTPGQATSGVGAVDQVSALDLENGPDAVQLYRVGVPSFVGLDAIAYGAVTSGLRDLARNLPAIEGTPTPDPAATTFAFSLARRADGVDTDDNSADLRVAARPTPGAPNGAPAFVVTAIEPRDAPLGRTATITLTLAEPTDQMTVRLALTPAPTPSCAATSASTLRCVVPWPASAPNAPARVALTVEQRAEVGGRVVVPDAFTWWRAVDDTGVPGELDYGVLQFPPTLTVAAGATTPTTYARAYELGVTEAPGPASALRVELGVGPAGSDPRLGGWRWVPARFNVQVGNDEEYAAELTAPPTPGAYAYTFRVSLDGGLTWSHVDTNGSGANAGLTLDPVLFGAMTVTP